MKLTSPNRHAVTLLELSVTVAILGTVMTMVSQSISLGSSMHESVSAESDLTNRADRLVKQLAYQLRSADYNWITITNGTVSTYDFTLCTGLTVSGPVFNQGYSLAYDSAAGTLSATVTDKVTGQILQREVASGLRKPDAASGIEPGFQLTQLGTALVVTGNQLQLSVALEDTLRDNQVITRSASSVIFLRSTMYANANLTSSPTQTSPSPTPSPTPTSPSNSTAAAPIILIGSDTDNTTGAGNRNNLLIMSQVTMPSGTSDTVKYSTFTLTTDKQTTDTPQKTSYTVNKGWETHTIDEDKFLLSGWVKGSLTLTVTVQSTGGKTTTATKTF